MTERNEIEDIEPALQQARAKLSTSRLLRASAELIVERGYERTTLAAIGQRAGYSHGLVTRRFGSKDGLLLALLQKMISEWQEREVAPVMRGRSGVEALCVMIDQIRASARRDPSAVRALYTLMFEGLRNSPEVLHERMREVHRDQRRLMERAVAEGIRLGTVRAGVDAGTTAALVISAIRGAAYQWLLDDEFDFDSTLAALETHVQASIGVEMRIAAGPGGKRNG